MKVLVIQQKMIGDVLTSTIICQAIKELLPEVELHYMVQPGTVAVLTNNPYINVIEVFKPEEKNKFISLIRQGFKLRKHKYDAVIDAYGKWESIIPAFLSGSKKRIGIKKWYTTFFYNVCVRQRKVTNGAIINRLRLAEYFLNRPVPEYFPKIYLNKEEVALGKKLITEQSSGSKPIFMISLLGSDEIKSLPSFHMALLLDSIIQQIDVDLILNYMPNQKKEADEIINLCQSKTKEHIIDVQSNGLRELLCVLSHCDAIIGNEGGAINMAKALDVPTFAIFAPWINKEAWGFRNDFKKHIVVHLKDYQPEIYGDEDPKYFKSQSLDLYQKLKISDYKYKLTSFLEQFEGKTKINS